MVKLRGVEQLLRFGQRGLVEPFHALHNLHRGGRSVEGKVDIHVAAVARLGCQANKLDLEIFEALEAELFAKTVHARNRNAGARGKFLNRKPADVLTDGKGCNAELLLGGGEALRLGNLAFDIHANSHTRQTCQKGTGLFWHVSVGVRKCQGRAAAGLENEKECRVWRARFCPSRAQAILGLSTRDAKEILIPRALPGRACDSSPRLSNLIIWHYNHHRHAQNVALNQEEKTYGSV